MEKPIIFNADDVRAILDGRKTQTRRIVKRPPWHDKPSNRWLVHGRERIHLKFHTERDAVDALPLVCPYGKPGSQLWVRETFQPLCADGVEDASETNYKTGKGCTVSYPATDGIKEFVDAYDNISDACRPSIHMPRWASRITLQVEAVRVERIQDITDADAIAEGVDRTNTSISGYARERFVRLWGSIYGPASWDANPLVWVIEFKRIQP